MVLSGFDYELARCTFLVLWPQVAPYTAPYFSLFAQRNVSKRKRTRHTAHHSAALRSGCVRSIGAPGARCEGRVQVLRRGMRGMDAEQGTMGQGWPFETTLGAASERGNPERSAGPDDGASVLLTFAATGKSETPSRAEQMYPQTRQSTRHRRRKPSTDFQSEQYKTPLKSGRFILAD